MAPGDPAGAEGRSQGQWWFASMYFNEYISIAPTIPEGTPLHVTPPYLRSTPTPSFWSPEPPSPASCPLFLFKSSAWTSKSKQSHLRDSRTPYKAAGPGSAAF